MREHLDYAFNCEKAFFEIKTGVVQFRWDFLLTDKHENEILFRFS